MNKAIVLLGPTGIGKTPLGELMESRGFCGRRCLHFDFGANLRRVAASFEGVAATDPRNDVFSLPERAVILNSLATGALLEDRDFPIAEKILDRFASEKNVGPRDLLVMNGLPRHVGQARDLIRSVAIVAVVHLTGSAAVMRERILHNRAGDRAGRTDDTTGAIERKLEIFEKRTLPLIDFYGRREVPIMTIAVGAKTTAEEICGRLEKLVLPLG